MTETCSHSIAVAVNCGLSGMSMTGGHAGTHVFMPREQITNFKYAKPVREHFGIVLNTIVYGMRVATPASFLSSTDSDHERKRNLR